MTLLDRRGLLRASLAATGGLVATPVGVGLVALDPVDAAPLPEKRLAFRNIHNNETVDARFFGPQGFDPEGLAEINHGLRDWRTNEVTRMDPALILLLATLRETLEVSPRARFDIISGYRSPQTNAALHARSGGVASKSQHMLGKATDIALPGTALDRVHQAALSLKRGGVGFYPQSGFVHVDTGRVRHW